MLVTNDADRPSGSGSNPKLVLFAVSFNDICPSLAHCSFASAALASELPGKLRPLAEGMHTELFIHIP
jgi:hypothetical protein